MKRAYSMLQIRSVADGERVIRGIATTPTPDRMGDIVEPLGVEFKNPLPLLHQHDHTSPVGEVIFSTPTKDGIEFEARVASIDEPGSLKERCDLAWQEVKAGLVRAVSIGFRTLEHAIMDGGGWRFIKTEVLELSLVTVPANADCTITQVRSIDRAMRGAPAETAGAGDGADAGSPAPKGATAPILNTTRSVVHATAQQGASAMNIAEQIKSFQATRQAKSARMESIMAAAAEDGATLDDAQSEEYDTLEAEVGSIDKHLARFASLEKAQAQNATPIVAGNADEGSTVRGGTRIEVKGANVPQGTAFTRFVMAVARTKGDLTAAERFAEHNKAWENTPEVSAVLKAAATAGTTSDASWARPLAEYQGMTAEFVELLRPATILGKIEGVRRVPFNTKLVIQTGGALVGWVGETKLKPVGNPTFENASMDLTKAAGIVVLSDELVRSSSPSAEATVKEDLKAQMARFLDEQFVDPTITAIPNVRPASITHGIDDQAAGGNSADAARAAIAAALGAMVADNVSIGDVVAITSEATALYLSTLRNALGQSEFTGLTATGGLLDGRALITSQSVPAGVLILVKASDIMLADDGEVLIDVSREATLVMDGAPVDGAAPTFNLWQNNAIGIRAERFINWKRVRTSAVQVVTGIGTTV